MRKKNTPKEIWERFYSEDEVALILGITTPTLRNRIYANQNHPPYKAIGRAKWFDKAEFWKWFDKQPTKRAS